MELSAVDARREANRQGGVALVRPMRLMRLRREYGTSDVREALADLTSAEAGVD
jgi:hypothetical protein